MADEGTQPPPEEIVLYEKDPHTKIATITLNRPDRHNAPTIASRHRFAELVHRANVDDDVKVLIIRGAGKHFGTGADLPEMAGMFSEKPTRSLLHEFKIGGEEGVKYPPKDSYRYLASLTQLYANSNFRAAQPPGLQEDQHHRGERVLLRLAFLPGGRCRSRDLLR